MMLDDVTFHYAGASDDALRGVSLRVDASELVADRGPQRIGEIHVGAHPRRAPHARDRPRRAPGPGRPRAPGRHRTRVPTAGGAGARRARARRHRVGIDGCVARRRARRARACRPPGARRPRDVDAVGRRAATTRDRGRAGALAELVRVGRVDGDGRRRRAQRAWSRCSGTSHATAWVSCTSRTCRTKPTSPIARSSSTPDGSSRQPPAVRARHAASRPAAACAARRTGRRDARGGARVLARHAVGEARARRHRPHDSRARVGAHRRPQRLGQVDACVDHGRPGRAERG